MFMLRRRRSVRLPGTGNLLLGCVPPLFAVPSHPNRPLSRRRVKAIVGLWPNPTMMRTAYWDATRRAGAKWSCSCVIHHVFGPTKPRDSCIAARPFSIQRHPRIMAGRSLNSFKSRSITITADNPTCKRQDATSRPIRQ